MTASYGPDAGNGPASERLPPTAMTRLFSKPQPTPAITRNRDG